MEHICFITEIMIVFILLPNNIFSSLIKRNTKLNAQVYEVNYPTKNAIKVVENSVDITCLTLANSARILLTGEFYRFSR